MRSSTCLIGTRMKRTKTCRGLHHSTGNGKVGGGHLDLSGVSSFIYGSPH